ncbi:MAG TPA: hypothetical protein VM470_08010, partial [Acidimicrobiia bacterium]|nr:hypothetical protein [Acidimicrobiia bacterium]
MRREALELEILEINVGPRLDPEPKPPQPKSSVWGTVVLGFAALATAFQFLPDHSSLATPIAALPEPAPVTTSLPSAIVSASETQAEWTWVEVDGLERFESITAPIETDRGYVIVGNPIGLSRGASVVISDDGVRWNRIGTIHGVGGEVNVVDIDRFQGQFLALGTYTEKMPISEAEPRLQLPAV